MKKFAVVGWKTSTQLLEKIHRGNFAMDGVDAMCEAVEVPSGEFESRIPELLKEYDGMSVAAPYRERIVPFLSKLDASATKYKAVDTVKRCACHGDITGYNTDVAAFLDMYGADLVGMRILVLGVGGAGRPIAEALEKDVFDTQVVSMNRVADEKIVEAMNNGELDVVVNATPVELPFAVPAWINVIDLRADAGGEKLMLLQAAKAEAIWFPKEDHHEHCACGCGGHHHECGHHHD